MSKQEKRLNAWDKLMMAVTFAEAGDHETAKNINAMVEEKGKRPEKRNEANRPELRV